MYQAANLVILVYNIYLLKRSMWIHDVGRTYADVFVCLMLTCLVVVSITSFAALVITSLARTSPNFQPAGVVWTTFTNESGWVDAIAFLTGLVNPNYMYAGIDGAIHLAEECKNASMVVPRALMCTIGIGFFTSFVFAIVMVYCTNDFEAAVTTPTGTTSASVIQKSS